VKPLHWKLLLIGAVIAWALFQAWPRAERPFLNMKLGLDLKGGSYLVMQVQTDDALKAEADIVATRMADRLRKEGLTDARAVVSDTPGEVVVTGIPAGRLPDVQKLIQEEASSWLLSPTGSGFTARVPNAEAVEIRDKAVRQAVTTIQSRIDAFGVAETSLTRVGGDKSDRILVQLPGVEDPSRVKRVIQTQARLELRSAYYAPDGAGPFVALTREEVLSQFGGKLPVGVEVLPVEGKSDAAQARPGAEQAAPKIVQWMAVDKTAVITGTDLQDARPSTGEWNQTVVSFALRVSAADRFAKFTREHIGKQMPIVLDGKIRSAPSIRGEISTHGQIEGNFTRIEADDLSLTLRAGALPARVTTIEERTVGPSLGRDSISAGVRASLIGALAVCAFMLLYYRLSGLNALAALAINLLILAAGMAALGATLTLPGIAGYALTVGMAVDANVLIFERIREELRAGKTVRGAIEAGFNKAFSAIFDSNLTTIISALFLFQYGTGPVRGFAVSLTIGLLANMFTAVFVSKVIFELVLRDRPVKTLSI